MEFCIKCFVLIISYIFICYVILIILPLFNVLRCFDNGWLKKKKKEKKKKKRRREEEKKKEKEKEKQKK